MSKENLTNAVLARELEDLGLKVPTAYDGTFDRERALELRKMKLEEIEVDKKLRRKVRVMFHHSTNPSAGGYVYGSVNDHNFQAPYGVEVEIPEFVLRGSIDNAKTVTYERISRPGQPDEFVRRETMVYPYTFLGYAEETDSEAKA